MSLPHILRFLRVSGTGLPTACSVQGFVRTHLSVLEPPKRNVQRSVLSCPRTETLGPFNGGHLCRKCVPHLSLDLRVVRRSCRRYSVKTRTNNCLRVTYSPIDTPSFWLWRHSVRSASGVHVLNFPTASFIKLRSKFFRHYLFYGSKFISVRQLQTKYRVEMTRSSCQQRLVGL